MNHLFEKQAPSAWRHLGFTNPLLETYWDSWILCLEHIEIASCFLSFLAIPQGCFEMCQPFEKWAERARVLGRNQNILKLNSLFLLCFSGFPWHFLVNNWLKLVFNTLELLLILFSVNYWPYRLIDGLFGQFLELYSALGSWLMAKRSQPGPRGPKDRWAWTPGRGLRRSFGPREPGRPLLAMSREPNIMPRMNR